MRLKSTKRIEICGIIASGKTSLVKVLESAIPNTCALYEDFGANPFLSSFYSDPDKFSFETEITFLLQHYSAIKAHLDQERIVVCDYSLLLDEAFARVTLKDSQYETFMNVYAETIKSIGKPDLTIRLTCQTNDALERIKKRSRDTEQGISDDYLDSLDASISMLINKISEKERVIEINTSSVNYIDSQTGLNYVLQKISDSMF